MAKIKKKVEVTQKTTSRLSNSEKLARSLEPTADKRPVDVDSVKNIGLPSQPSTGPAQNPQTPQETPKQSAVKQEPGVEPAPEKRIPEETLTQANQPLSGMAQPPSGESGADGEQPERLEDISPSLKKKDEEPSPQGKLGDAVKDKSKDKVKDVAKDKAKDAGKKAGEEVAKKGAKQIALNAARAVGTWLAGIASSIAGAIGWPWLVGCLVVFLIILLIFGGLGCQAINGNFGGVLPESAGKDDPNVKKLIAASKEKAPAIDLGISLGEGIGNLSVPSKYYKFELTNDRDKEFLESGKIDRRLAAALAYLVDRHDHIRVSHLVSGYEDTKINPESGKFFDSKVDNNISAHRRGQAADIEAIDMVSKKCKCGSKTPIEVVWQAIGESPFGEVPDALSTIDSVDDILTPEVRAALEELGVTGLDQDNLIERMMQFAVLAQIDSVYDLMDKNVLLTFAEIGVNGLDNAELQQGLKRAQAIQKLYELNIDDITSLENEEVKGLVGDALGVEITDEMLDKMKAYKKQYEIAQLLADISDPNDLQKTEIQKALSDLGVNINDPQYQKYIKQTIAANTILNWTGDPDDEIFKESLAVFNITLDTKMLEAYNTFKYARDFFKDPGITTDAAIIAFLDSASVEMDSPQAQKSISMIKSGYFVLQKSSNPNSKEFWDAVYNLSLNVQNGDDKLDTMNVINKYKSANYLLDYHGDFSEPEFAAAMKNFDIDITNGTANEAIRKYKAAYTLKGAADGKIALDSQEVKDALSELKIVSFGDDKTKAAIRLGNATSQDDPQTKQDKETLGMYQAEYQVVLGKIQAAKNLLNIKDFSSLQDEQVQQDLAKMGLNDARFFDALDTIGSVQKLLDTPTDDLVKAGSQAAMTYLGINDPKLYNSIGKIVDLQKILNIDNLTDLKSEQNQKALRNLNIKDPKVYEYIANIGSIQTLANIRSPLDLTKPSVIKALSDLKITSDGVEGYLADAGAIYSLTQMKSPEDLLKPDNLKALDQLGVIDLNTELLGQIGAVQTLLTIDSVGDVFKPNTVLALNALGLVSLSNPITAALTVLSVLDGLLGGGIFGGCQGNTNCYKPKAQEKVNKVIGELLQFPYDAGKPDYYKVTQLITYSEVRDVLPFAVQLNSLYGRDRNNNVGLFAMPEMHNHIHIGY